MSQLKPLLQFLQISLQIIAMAVIALATLATGVWAVLATAGLQPWPEIFPGAEEANHYFIVGIAVLGASLLCFLPSNLRILQLENSHRNFTVGMEDVARAYHAAHAADRAGLFKAASEYDAVKERLLYLRNHPDLSTLEPDILELAAEMSRTSEALALTYSDENVARAHGFLTQRQQEIDRFNTRLDRAKSQHAALMSRLSRVKLDEAVAQSQLARFRDELKDLLPELSSYPPMRSSTSHNTQKPSVLMSDLAAE